MRACAVVIVVFWIALLGLSLPYRVLGDVPPTDANTPEVSLIVRDSYLPGIPVLVRVQIVDSKGVVDRDICDANAVLSVSGDSAVGLSTDRVALCNGLGSGLVTFTGSGDFELTVSVGDVAKTVRLVDWTDEPVHIVSGTVTESQTWSGVYHITGGDLTISAGVTLTLSPGTLVLIDGAVSGTDGSDIDVQGAIESLGTATCPVTFTALAPGSNWGELHHADARPSTYRYTEIMQAGHSPKVGHSNSGPAVRASNSALTFDHVSLTDNAGKIMQASDGTELTFSYTLFARSVMGPEISGTSLLFEDGWIMEMRAKDDADGIYIHSQRSGQLCRLVRSVIAGADDDGIDTLGSDVEIEDCIVRACKDKAVSVYGGETTISRCLLVQNTLAPEDTTNASIAAKAFEDSTAVVNIDHTTLVTTRTPGHLDVAIQSHNKYGVESGTILYNVTNSILDATEPIYVQAPYLESDIRISYCSIVGVEWPGVGNLTADPLFVDPEHGNYRLDPNSPCLGMASPDSNLPDLGFHQSSRD
ncbi:MAG: right-handed parallel beta-helix repeat-containing protein [Phycisphaerales bacterium]